MTDLFAPQGPDDNGAPERPLYQRLLWFAGLAVISLLLVAATAYLLRGLLLIG